MLQNSTHCYGGMQLNLRSMLKKGFLASCRPFIGVDGCHLKTKFGGQLLIAVGRDANDQYYPLAFGVVENETKESWRWFLTLLLEDIGSDKRWVFISDQQKGLIPVFEEMFERVEHRLCLRHLYANFKKKFGGGTAIRDLMMGAAKATYQQAWDKKMNELKALDKKAWEWLIAHDPKLWWIPCRHVVAAMSKRSQVPADFVDDYYSRDAIALVLVHSMVKTCGQMLTVMKCCHQVIREVQGGQRSLEEEGPMKRPKNQVTNQVIDAQTVDYHVTMPGVAKVLQLTQQLNQERKPSKKGGAQSTNAEASHSAQVIVTAPAQVIGTVPAEGNATEPVQVTANVPAEGTAPAQVTASVVQPMSKKAKTTHPTSFTQPATKTAQPPKPATSKFKPPSKVKVGALGTLPNKPIEIAEVEYGDGDLTQELNDPKVRKCLRKLRKLK
ncbi:hypothetical protein TSUD_314310 [Trifolium subterraneum]|uniref:MULE transposase domain-containing protein n=1 Tax=Trifolium subterraneum TaxID=3900 RepID=A0A2Z6M452_TRISU|nr:hypothetical protein TSUD_314310 [Trifolium subterraneum]